MMWVFIYISRFREFVVTFLFVYPDLGNLLLLFYLYIPIWGIFCYFFIYISRFGEFFVTLFVYVRWANFYLYISICGICCHFIRVCPMGQFLFIDPDLWNLFDRPFCAELLSVYFVCGLNSLYFLYNLRCSYLSV